MMSDDRYIYHGPVLNSFHTLVDEKWYGETTAQTKEKAISNLKYQFRKESELSSCAKLYFDLSRLTRVAPVKIKKDVLESKDEEEWQRCTQLKLF